MANEPLLRQVVDTIINDPASFDMEHWGNITECGTTYCVAGWAVVLSGHELVFVSEYDETSGKTATKVYGRNETIDLVAQELLELTDQEAMMFYDSHWCKIEGITDLCGCGSCGYGMHPKATRRQVIENITEVTGIEFKIPDHVK